MRYARAMQFPFISKNGVLLGATEAHIPIDRIEYQYGFGVYETIRVVAGKPRFAEEHLERLFNSASIIGLEHHFEASFVRGALLAMIEKIDVAIL